MDNHVLGQWRDGYVAIVVMGKRTGILSLGLEGGVVVREALDQLELVGDLAALVLNRLLGAMSGISGCS